MLKKEITFPDLDGNPVQETFYFYLNEADIARLNFSRTEDLSEYMTRVIRSNSRGEIYDLIETFIQKSIGRRHEDNIQFIKNKEITDRFMQSNAYSTLLMELGGSAGDAADFIKGIMPTSIQKSIEEAGEAEENSDVELPFSQEVSVSSELDTDDRPAWIREGRDPNQKELQTMTPEQMREAYIRKVQQ